MVSRKQEDTHVKVHLLQNQKVACSDHGAVHPCAVRLEVACSDHGAVRLPEACSDHGAVRLPEACSDHGAVRLPEALFPVHHVADYGDPLLLVGNNQLFLWYVPYFLKAGSCLRLKNNSQPGSWLRTQLLLDLIHSEADQREVIHLPFPLLHNEPYGRHAH